MTRFALLLGLLIYAPVVALQSVAAEAPALHASEAARDYWPGKYVKLPAGNLEAPAKLTYVTITKVGDEYQIEGFEGRRFRSSNMNRSLDEFTLSSILREPLAQLALGTATLQGHGVLQIVIDVFAGKEHFYLVRAEPLK